MKNEIIIYKDSKNKIALKVKFDGATIWLNQKEIAALFDVNQPAIAKHLKNIFSDGELKEKSVHSILEYTADDGKKYKTKFYNLDAIISVGYRVNSGKATKFRIWATSVLKEHLIRGYTINEKRLQAAQNKFHELQSTIALLAGKVKTQNLKGQEAQILSLLRDYSKSLTFLEQFDKNRLPEPKGKKSRFVLKYEEAKKVLEEVKKELIDKSEATDLFAQERNDTFAGIVGNVYQTFGGNELYETIGLKAAHLLYFIIKDHPFSDGNKRSASFLFIYFLDKNHYLLKRTGEKKINDNALTALALLVAESAPKEKEIMIKLITNLIVA
jgi:death-on-curing family protein